LQKNKKTNIRFCLHRNLSIHFVHFICIKPQIFFYFIFLLYTLLFKILGSYF